MPISANALERTIELIVSHFGSQRAKQWFDVETFRGLAPADGHGMLVAGALRGGLRCSKARPSLMEGPQWMIDLG